MNQGSGRRRALSASGTRATTPSQLRVGMPSSVIPLAPQPNKQLFQPVLERVSPRARSASLTGTQMRGTGAVLDRGAGGSNLLPENTDATLQRRPNSASVSGRIKSALDQGYNLPEKIVPARAEVEPPLVKSSGVSATELEGGGTYPLSTTTPHPELSVDSEGIGVTRSHGIDTRSSMEDFSDDMANVDIGLSTVPNKYCTVREAIELRKLLLLSKGSRGGIAPSSSAVMDMYMVGSVIGVGSYGKVRSAWHRLTGRKVAIKTYDKSRLKDQSHWKRVHSEIKIMETVSHPRVARMYEAVETPKRLHLIMECIDGGNLCAYVKQKKRLHEVETRKIFFQLMLAIEYLHREGIAHRDIKLENVLFTDGRDIKLIDFGFSTIQPPGRKIKLFCGTPSYMAPEIVLRTEYEGPPVDIWGAGVLLYACLCGQFPFRAQSYPDLYRRIARGSFSMPDDISSSARDLLRLMLCIDAGARPSASAVLKHPWLQTQLVSAPDISRLRTETVVLISENPSDDIDSQAVTEIVRFGISRDELLRLLMSKTHSSVATLYYLFLDALFASRAQSGAVPKVQPLLPQQSVSALIGAKKDVTAGMGSPSQPTSALATQFLLRNAGGAGVLNLRPRSASASRAAGQSSRPLSATFLRR